MEPFALGPDEPCQDHACASLSNYTRDVALLNYLLQDLRALARQAASGQISLSSHQRIVWRVHGLARRTVICDPVRLLHPEPVHVVGFFGDRREQRDDVAIEQAEVELIGELQNYPGIYSYSSVELVDGYWANLVVHGSVDDRRAWRGSRAHVHAADELAPKIYNSVRIHNGCLDGGVVGGETIVLESTKYWDYDVTPTWHAQRILPSHTATVMN